MPNLLKSFKAYSSRKTMMKNIPISSDEQYAKHRANYLKNREKLLEQNRKWRENMTPEQKEEQKRKYAEYREKVRRQRDEAMLKRQRLKD
tara:strand:+ start:32 stop:301 length:270 start_codon:yes stop_codon:yes gene_type:complete